MSLWDYEPLTPSEFRALYTCEHGYCPFFECPECEKHIEEFKKRMTKASEAEAYLLEYGDFKDIAMYLDAEIINGKLLIRVALYDSEELMTLDEAIAYFKAIGIRNNIILLAEKLRGLSS